MTTAATPARRQRRVTTADSPGMRRIVRVLAEQGPMDCAEIARAAHVSTSYVSAQARYVLLAAGRIHLHGYRRSVRGRCAPIYAAGPAPDGPAVEPPPKITSAQRARRWKAQTGYLEAQKAARRLRCPPDPVMRALLGIPAARLQSATEAA